MPDAERLKLEPMQPTDEEIAAVPALGAPEQGTKGIIVTQ